MIALVVAFSLAIAGFGGSQSARLSVPDTSPFTVSGVGFKAGEHVTLKLSSANTLTRVVVADPSGRFLRRVLLFKLRQDCGSYVVSARGDRGSVAVMKVVPECANVQPVDG